jgi:hypothetical protein
MSQVEIGAKVTVDASNASSRVLELQQSVKKLNEEFKNTKEGTDEQKQAFLNLQQAQNDLKKANKELGTSLNETSNEAKEGSGSFKNLKEQIATISPAAGGAAEGAGKFNAALNILKANPIIAILALLTALIVALVSKFKDMDAASDKMSDAWGELSGIFESFMNAILTPLIDGFVSLIGYITKAAEFLGDKLGISSKEASQNLGRLTKANRELDESQKAQAESLAASNRKLQEAREIAGDANRPIKERVAALKEAAKEEKLQLDQVTEWNRQKLAIQLEQFAQEMGARDKVIGKIKEGSLESLKAAKAELLSMKNVNEDKVQELSKYIIAAEDAAAQSAKIGKKTASQIASLDREEATKREQKQKERDDKIKQKNENDAAYAIRMEKLKQAEILAGITDQYDKERKIAEFKLKDDIRIAEEDLKNKKITGKQKIALIEQLKKDEAAKIKEIDDKEAAAKKKEEEEKKKQEAIDAKKKADEEKADAKKKLDEAKALSSDQSLKANERRALLDAERALNKEYYDKGLIDKATYLKNGQDIDKADTEIKKQENEAKQQLLDSYLGALDGVANVIGKQTAAGKAISVASALISTYQGIAKGVQLGYPMAIPAVIAAATTGFAAVKNILAVKVPNSGGGGGGSTPVTPNLGSAPLMPREQTTTTSLTGQTLASMNATASRAYVVESDITSGQQRMERINRAARLA